MKLRYRILIVAATFLIALYIFSGSMEETFFSGSPDTIEMSSATFPTISILVGESEFNVLHGYASNLNEMVMRESITPLASDRSFTVLITENECIVKKLQYEILNENGQELESNSMIILDSDTNRKSVQIQLQETMKTGSEYVAKITLITNQSKRIYYYTRLKMYDNGHLSEKLEFVDYFHRTLLNKDTSADVLPYLEPSAKADNSSFAFVNIHSSHEMVSWSDLEPTVIFTAVPTITEFYDSMASITLFFIVSVDNDNVLEYYTVKENYRFNYTEKRVYLYNYERHMEALFDINNTSLIKNEFKLGITSDIAAQTAISDNQKFISFVYGRELLLYCTETNNVVVTFTFRKGTEDYLRDLYDNHDVHILRMHDNGNVDFLVYGYMNRGEYEGRVGIVLYRYFHDSGRIEEQLYLPVNSTYQLLKSDMTDFAYLNEYDMFYFSLFDSIYSFSLVTKDLKLIASGVPEENMVYCEQESYVAWQDNISNTLSKNIYILNLETSELFTISAPDGENIRLYGRVNNNIIYGYAKHSDAYIYSDGNSLIPSYKIYICNGHCEILKTYQKEGYYITNVTVNENVITLSRVQKRLGSPIEYIEVSNDSILNRLEEISPPVEITRRITDRMLTEYYVSLPGGIEITKIPEINNTLNTIINQDTTVRINEPADRTKLYYAYSFGEVVFTSPRAAEAIKAADANVGTVINSMGRLMWERGVKSARSEISGIVPVYTDSLTDTIQASMSMLLNYKNIEANVLSYNSNTSTISEWLSRYMRAIPVELTGSTLDEALYYIYKKRPVIAIREDGSACLITAYDALSITVIDPRQKNSLRYPIKDAEQLFEEAGNRFISFVE